MLKKLRKNAFINKILRNIIKFSHKNLDKIKNKWRVSGIIPITFAKNTIKVYAECDDGIIDALFYEHHYIESQDLNLFIHFAKESNVIIDVGANTGIYSLLASKANQKAEIYAFEPHPINQKRLQKNISLNEFSNIEVVHKAVGNENKLVNFTIPEGDIISDTSSVNATFSKSTYKGQINWKNIEVEQITLNDFFSAQNQNTLIKIDVEGYEMNLFEGAKEFFRTHSPIIFCEIFISNQNQQYFEDFLNEYNYNAYITLKEGLLRLGKKLIPNSSGHNFIFAKGITNSILTSYQNISLLFKELSTYNSE